MADLLAVGCPEVATAPVDDEPALGWTVVLRRKPARMVDGHPEGGYTDAYELICCECGDDPDQDYRDVPRRLQRVRGPYAVAAGIAAYARHVRLRHGQQPVATASPAHRVGHLGSDADRGSRRRG